MQNAIKDGLTKQQFIKKYREVLDVFKWDEKSGYLYIFDTMGAILYHGEDKKFESKNVFELSKDNKELNEFLKDTTNKDEHFGCYMWYKPNVKVDEMYKKYVYTKKDSAYGVYIAAGIYKDELDKNAQQMIFEELEKEVW